MAGNGGVGGSPTGIGDKGDDGDAGLETGGAVYARGPQLDIANNILAHSTVTVAGTIADRGGNLSTDLNALLTHNTSLRFTNPLLSGPASNGGPTLTMAIATNSPAVDAALDEFCPPVDQRGTNRLGRCDIGAFESGGAPAVQPPPEIPTNVLNGLTVSLGTNLVILQWPAGYTNLYLQSATNLLATNTPWMTNTYAVTTNNGSNVVTVSATNSFREFFRRLYACMLRNLCALAAVRSFPASAHARAWCRHVCAQAQLAHLARWRHHGSRTM
jgi:hypothetical protein